MPPAGDATSKNRDPYYNRTGLIDLDELIKALGGGGPGGPPPPPPGRAPPQLPLELAMWGPTGSSVAYVFGANIYYR